MARTFMVEEWGSTMVQRSELARVANVLVEDNGLNAACDENLKYFEVEAIQYEPVRR